MKAKANKYDGNPLGLPPSFLSICEALGRAAVKGAQERQNRICEAQIVDTDYEVVEPNLLPQNASNDEPTKNEESTA
jgi:hypothetical protein